MQRYNPTEDWLALVLALCVFAHDTWANFNLLAESKSTGQDGTTSNTTLEFVDFGTGFVDIEGTDDDQFGVGGEVTDGYGDALDDVLVHGVDVVFELGGNGDNGRGFGNSS